MKVLVAATYIPDHLLECCLLTPNLNECNTTAQVGIRIKLKSLILKSKPVIIAVFVLKLWPF
jgi:hypothetical protein